MPQKQYVAIICEYNPFHYGHLFQIQTLKKKYDGVVCIMSGNFVQRGELSVADKYIRAKSAVLCGADLVLELPFPYCMLSATDFADAGVTIAHLLGVDALGFGCEDNFSLLTDLSRLMDSNDFKSQLSELIKTQKNLSYPKAIEVLVSEILGPKYGKIIQKPNNILTLEYLSAIRRNNYALNTHPVIRDTTLRSSSYIRGRGGKNEILSFLPECSANAYRELPESLFPNSTENLSQFIIGMLRTLPKHPKKVYYSTPTDLYHIIRSKSEVFSSFYSLTESCQNNLYTSARVRRSILSMVFGITGEQTLCKPTFTTLLAANSTGRVFLSEYKKTIQIPIITKPSHADDLPEPEQKAYLFQERAENIISLAKNPGCSEDRSILGYIKKAPRQKSPFILN